MVDVEVSGRRRLSTADRHTWIKVRAWGGGGRDGRGRGGGWVKGREGCVVVVGRVEREVSHGRVCG